MSTATTQERSTHVSTIATDNAEQQAGAVAPAHPKADGLYAPGRTKEETQRLIEQSDIYRVSTRRLFEDAGITTGMKVLDVGSGAGDVALLAADLVGPTGSVVGVDVNPGILETAQARASAAGLANVTFRAGDFRALPLADDFDAVVGRFVLMYVADPAAALRSLAAHLRPGGIVIFQEIDLGLAQAFTAYVGASPLARRMAEWGAELYRRTGAHADMGVRLFGAYQEAGLPAPQLSLFAPMGGGADWAGYAYATASYRSLLPLLEKFGIATADDVGVDTLADRLRADVVATHLPGILNPVVGTWAKTHLS